jgi:hypothetical protein
MRPWKRAVNRRWFVKNGRCHRWVNRMKALSHYSGGTLRCDCCSENKLEFLVLDHVGGGGMKHRRLVGGGGQSVYYDLKRRKFPSGFRVLCSNCNASLGAYGYCPHGGRRRDVAGNEVSIS